MKKFAHLLLFLAAFQVEVRVRASESTAVSFPENCIGKSIPCSFKVTEDKWSYEAGAIKLRAPMNTILTENSKTRDWTVVEGSLWVQNAPSVRVKTVSAEVEASSGQYWVFAEKNRTVFRNISSKLVVTFKDQSKMEIPRGFEIWVGSVNSEAKVEHGMVEPIDLKQHLKSWFALYPGTRQQFVSEVQDLKDQWADLIEESGDIYKKVAERKMAALDEEKRKQLEVQKKKDDDRRQLRERFHKRVFEY
ncbi:hypothetical protein [Bdellovibrio sp. HCB337]|uniref:hypothetical protein n=1 Tax=Bdellovibrio sp. HCB337 TaxID=3394358 RepID=UPI0039A467C2